MPSETQKRAGWKVGLGYTAFGLFAFVVFVYLTFPYDAFRDRLVAEAERAGFTVRIGSMGPGLLGITARSVRIERPAANAGEVAPGTPVPTAEILIPEAKFSPSFVPLGLAFDAQVFGGEVSGAVGGVGNGSLQLELEKLDATKGDLKSLTGLDLAGVLDGKVMLTIPLVENSPRREYDLARTDGRIDLQFRNLTINGGTVTVPYMGQPTPFDLPRIHAGDLKANVRFEKGLGTVENFQGIGEDVSVRTEGTVKLAKAPEHSELNLDFKVKAEPDFVKRLGIIGSGLSLLPSDKMDPNYRVARITGFLSGPRFATAGR